MRSRLAAATLILSAALCPSLAQSPSVETLAARSEAKSEAKGRPHKRGHGGSDSGTAAQSAPVRPEAGQRNISATGKMMPPTTGREGAAPLKSSTEIQMLKAQKAAEERNKAWDAKMRRTMSTICNGC